MLLSLESFLLDFIIGSVCLICVYPEQLILSLTWHLSLCIVDICLIISVLAWDPKICNVYLIHHCTSTEVFLEKYNYSITKLWDIQEKASSQQALYVLPLPKSSTWCLRARENFAISPFSHQSLYGCLLLLSTPCPFC